MNVKLFGKRVLVEFHRPKTDSKIIIPDAAQNRDSHRLGIVRFIGDGRVKNKTEPVPSLVKEGDVVMFQLNGIMEATQKFVLAGKHYMNIVEDDLIARINGDDLSIENLEMLGDYVLLKHFIRQQPGSTLFLPDNAVRQSAPDFIYFRCVQKGTTVDLPFGKGDELVVNFGRLTPMFIVKRKADGTSENLEFAYTRKEWVDGVVEAPGDDAQ
jgi:co-chaperonin GroES (HSP10)